METLKIARKAKNYTQQKLSLLLGISRSAISMWETGECQPDNGTLVRLSALLGVSTDYLLGAEKTKTRDVPALSLPEDAADLLRAYSRADTRIKNAARALLDLPPLRGETTRLVPASAVLTADQQAELIRLTKEFERGQTRGSHKGSG